jgi:hypothetical protein
MGVTIEHEQYDILFTKSSHSFNVEQVNVTTDGRTVEYLLQEEDEEGNPIGEPDWYDSIQIKCVGHGVYEIKKGDGEQQIK